MGAVEWRVCGCCVEGFWPTWFVVVAAVGRVPGWCVEGFWLMWFAVMGTPLLLRGGPEAVWGASGRRGLSLLLLSGRFLLGVWGASGWCVEGFWPMWFVVMGRFLAALWRVSGLCCCVEGFWLKWFVVMGRALASQRRFVAAAWRAFGRHGLSSWAGPLLLCGGFLAALLCGGLWLT